MVTKMKCSRPGCQEQEDRIDGCCSVHCRDVYDLELELETLRAYDNAFEGVDVNKIIDLGGVARLVKIAREEIRLVSVTGGVIDLDACLIDKER